MRSRWPIGPSVLVCLVPNAPAAAAEFGNGFGVAGGVSAVSDFRFRGISLSDEDVAVQGTITFAHDGGFYAGTWASSLEDSPLYGHTEVDLYAGWSGDIASGTKLDVGLTYYLYPNREDGVGDSDYTRSEEHTSELQSLMRIPYAVFCLKKQK